MIKQEVPILQTKHLTFKALTLDDVNQFYELASNPDVTRYLMWEHHKSISETEIFIKELLKKFSGENIYSWGIYDRFNNNFMGWIGLVENYPSMFKCEIGYWLGSPYWNKGYMTEALRCITDFCLNELKYKRVQAKHAVQNPVSGIVMEKCGYEREGILRNWAYFKNRAWDAAMYSVVNND